MVKVWLLDPRSRLAVRRRLAEFRLTRRSVLAAGMAVWLLYAALVWQFGGRRLENCSSLACRALLGGLPIGPAGASPSAAAAGSAAPAPTGGDGRAPATVPTAGPATTTTTAGPPLVLVPGTTAAPPAGAGGPTSTSAAGSAATDTSTTTTTSAAATTTTTRAPRRQCKPKKHRDCKPRKPHPAVGWWRLVANLARGW
jgi:hypothetical protein